MSLDFGVDAFVLHQGGEVFSGVARSMSESTNGPNNDQSYRNGLMMTNRQYIRSTAIMSHHISSGSNESLVNSFKTFGIAMVLVFGVSDVTMAEIETHDDLSIEMVSSNIEASSSESQLQNIDAKLKNLSPEEIYNPEALDEVEQQIEEVEKEIELIEKKKEEEVELITGKTTKAKEKAQIAESQEDAKPKVEGR
jgi:hypothetical protein